MSKLPQNKTKKESQDTNVEEKTRDTVVAVPGEDMGEELQPLLVHKV